ncbi:MAG: pyrroline-5-carboxylate reductase [Ruminococcaceae bacterium]|nr:pyrroline-5-carboxylate reductase [Oscillospiraceae bacterium]
MKIGFIGAGNMATAIIGGLIGAGTPASDICVFDMDKEKLDAFSKRGVCIAENSCELTEKSDIVVLAVKPQNYSEVLKEISPFATCDKTIVSIAAGITIEFVRNGLKIKCPVARVMPNTPLLVGKGATALCFSDNVSDDARKVVGGMFSCSGVVAEFTEDKMDAIISVNGSSPAYFYLFAKAMADYALSVGIDSERVMELICAAMEGSAKMLRESGDDPDTLIKKVSSKGGTTIEALNVFYKNEFENTIKDAMSACTKRAAELASEA